MTAKKCDNPDCDRKVSPGVQYCCAPCSWAHEGKYLIHSDGPLGHTRECNIRAKNGHVLAPGAFSRQRFDNQFTKGDGMITYEVTFEPKLWILKWDLEKQRMRLALWLIRLGLCVSGSETLLLQVKREE
jgi:hypothetical protein